MEKASKEIIKEFNLGNNTYRTVLRALGVIKNGERKPFIPQEEYEKIRQIASIKEEWKFPWTSAIRFYLKENKEPDKSEPTIQEKIDAIMKHVKENELSGTSISVRRGEVGKLILHKTLAEMKVALQEPYTIKTYGGYYLESEEFKKHMNSKETDHFVYFINVKDKKIMYFNVRIICNATIVDTLKELGIIHKQESNNKEFLNFKQCMLKPIGHLKPSDGENLELLYNMGKKAYAKSK